MTAFDTIVTALEQTVAKVVVRGAGARSQCPAHNSTGLTVSVRRGDDRARVTCFAGCDALEVLDALGLGLRDLYDGDRPGGYVPIRREPPNPLGDVEHFCDRILQQEQLEADPAWRERRAGELDAVGAHREAEMVRRTGRWDNPQWPLGRVAD